MKCLFALLMVAVSSMAAQAAEPQEIPIWPKVAPGSEGKFYSEQTVTGQDGAPRIMDVVRPTITVYLPDPAIKTGAAFLICPGGGFRYLSIEHEGIAVAKWLNSLGVTAFVLKYRVIHTPTDPLTDAATIAELVRNAIPLAEADGEQGIRVIRARAAEWGIAPDKIGIIGFSAGGQVATAAAMTRDATARPNFVAPIYPAAPEGLVPTAQAPPMFLVQADDDKTVPPMQNSIRIYEAWKRAGVPVEIHIYLHGGHGFGMRQENKPVNSWTDRFKDWLEQEGLLKKIGQSGNR